MIDHNWINDTSVKLYLTLYFKQFHYFYIGILLQCLLLWAVGWWKEASFQHGPEYCFCFPVPPGFLFQHEIPSSINTSFFDLILNNWFLGGGNSGWHFAAEGCTVWRQLRYGFMLIIFFFNFVIWELLVKKNYEPKYLNILD